MRVGRFVFLLLGFVVATLPLLSGCSGDLSHKPPAPTSSGEGGSSTTSSGGAGTGGTGTGPSCAGAKACVHASEIPFEPTVTMVAFGNPGQVPLCPGFAHVEGFTGYADPQVEPAHCPTCDCSPAACALPEEIHASAASCAGAEGAVSTPFDAPPGWEGTCTTENAVPAGKLCGGVPCAQSVTVAPVTVEPCKPVTKGAVEGPGVFPAPVWGAAVRECLIDVDTQGGGCGTGEWCAPVPPEGFQLCLYVKGDDPSYACREPFTERHVVFEGFGPDTRACSPCECGEPEGASCTAYVSIFSDGGCGDPLDAVTVAQAGPVCVDVPPGLGLASKAAQWKTAKPGTCAHSGGAASGEVAPVGAITLCCQPAPGPPP
jgi:hypothetical protein